MTIPSVPPKPNRRLFWRIYLHGLLLIVSVALAVIAVAVFADGDSRWHRHQTRLAALLAAQLGPVAGDPARLQARLDELGTSLDLAVAVFLPDGTALGAAGAPPPQALTPKELRSLGKRVFFRRRGAWHAAVPLNHSSSAYLLLRDRSDHVPGRFVASVLAILTAVALVSIPLARAIARPLEQLTTTARNLAGGDLSARTGVSRKDEVGALARAIDDMASRLQHRIRSERELLANISHEIRTPLARIRVALELLDEAEGGAEALKEHLAGIVDDGAELDRLVEDVLATVRLDLAAGGNGEAGFKPRLVSIEMANLLDQATRRFAAAHPAHTLRCTPPSDLPAMVADPDLVQRVLDNLLDNAAKYSDPTEPVEVNVEADSRAILVEVRDRGIGVNEPDLGRLFEPFFRTDRSRSRGVGGAGLGLTLCKRIVDAHGGEIFAAANPPRGTVIRFTLPLGGPEERPR